MGSYKPQEADLTPRMLMTAHGRGCIFYMIYLNVLVVSYSPVATHT